MDLVAMRKKPEIMGGWVGGWVGLGGIKRLQSGEKDRVRERERKDTERIMVWAEAAADVYRGEIPRGC